MLDFTMNPRRVLAHASLLLLAATAGPVDARVQMSDEATSRIRARFPEYDREKAEAIRAAEEAREREAMLAAGEEVVVLPEMTVIEKQRQKMVEEDLYRNGLYDEQLVRRELSDLDRALLNRYRLPLFGMSNKVRAREAYLERRDRKFREDVERTAFYVEQLDPGEAKALRAAMNGWK